MFNNVALDVVIGLVFIYLLYSLLGTLIEEIIATNIGLRGIILELAIKRMLDDSASSKKSNPKSISKFFKKIRKIVSATNDDADIHDKINELEDQVVGLVTNDSNEQGLPKVSSAFYAHPLIKYLRSDTLFIKKKPSYIDQETFSKVLIDLLRGPDPKPGSSDKHRIQHSLNEGEISWKLDDDQLIGGKKLTASQKKLNNAKLEYDTLIYLESVWADAQGDVAKFKTSLEQWFNEMMDRTTGWYKKYTQLILLFVGLAISIGFNVDTVKIVKTLQTNPDVRKQLIEQSAAFAKAHPDLGKNLTAVNGTDSKVGKDTNYKKEKVLSDTLYNQELRLLESNLSDVTHTLGIGWEGGISKNMNLYSIVGWLLTALAISMGAPFWFDLLNRLMQLRSSIAPKDDKDKDAKPSDAKVKNTQRVG